VTYENDVRNFDG
jgi:hypothetical protein